MTVGCWYPFQAFNTCACVVLSSLLIVRRGARTSISSFFVSLSFPFLPTDPLFFSSRISYYVMKSGHLKVSPYIYYFQILQVYLSKAKDKETQNKKMSPSQDYSLSQRSHGTHSGRYRALSSGSTVDESLFGSKTKRVSKGRINIKKYV